jgi:hypothetical protein
MPDESVSCTSTSTSTSTIVDRTDTRPAPRREATRDLDVRKALRSVAGLAASQSFTPGRPERDAAWPDGQRQTRWSDWGLVVFGGGMGIVALIVLVLSVLTVSDDSTHQPAPPRSSVAPSATTPPTATAPSPTAVVPSPSIAPPPMPATPTSSPQPAQTAPSETAPPPVPARVVPRRLHHLFPNLFPTD